MWKIWIDGVTTMILPDILPRIMRLDRLILSDYLGLVSDKFLLDQSKQHINNYKENDNKIHCHSSIPSNDI